MLKCVFLKMEMTVEYFFCGEMLFIDAALPKKRILEIIEKHLDLK